MPQVEVTHNRNPLPSLHIPIEGMNLKTCPLPQWSVLEQVANKDLNVWQCPILPCFSNANYIMNLSYSSTQLGFSH